jgi:hypothetical protein
MAGSADREYLRDADRDPPADEATSTTVAPGSPPAVTLSDETQPTNHARGSSTAPNLLDLGTIRFGIGQRARRGSAASKRATRDLAASRPTPTISPP